MSELPKISVVVATLNRVTSLKRLLDGLLREDYPSMEIVVVDGASTDGTVELLKSYDPGVVRWISEPDDGEYFAYNKAIVMARGEVIKPLTDDELLRPGAFKHAAEYFRNHPEVDIVFGRLEFWDAWTSPGEPSRSWQTPPMEPSDISLRNYLRQTKQVYLPGSFLRRRVFEQIGPFETKFAIGDGEFLARAAFRGIKMGVIPQIVTDDYLHGQSGVFTKWWKVEWDWLEINRRYGTASDVWDCFRRKIIPLPARWIFNKLGFHPRKFLERIKSKFAAASKA
jgi:glycosyltransferase involved in cell wall biosynthesis